jgi:tRNA A-37 threonylcarbamoyl transferase component Bud32
MATTMAKAGNAKAGHRQRQASVKAELDATVARLQTMDLSTLEEEEDLPSPGAAAAALRSSHPDGFRMPDGQIVPPSGFKEIAILGVGTFSRVRMMQYKGVTYAMKMMKKKKVDQLKQKTHIMNEKEIMIEMNHPFLLRLVSTYKDSTFLYMLLELCQGGELFSRLLELKTLDEDTTRFYAGCIVLALEALHSKNNIYRDLKPENILLDKQGYVKVVDFGFAKKVADRTYTTCGTPEVRRHSLPPPSPHPSTSAAAPADAGRCNLFPGVWGASLW